MKFDYTEYLAQSDLTTVYGVQHLLQRALNDWRDERITDLQLDDVLSAAIGAMNGPQPDV